MSALREILAKFSISVDDKELKKGNESISDGVTKLKTFATALGTGFALGAIREFVVGMTDMAIATETQAHTLRMSTEKWQEWAGVAQLAGVAASDLAGVFQNKLRPKTFEKVAEKISAIKDPIRQTQAAIWMFGDGLGQKLLPLLKKGSQGIQDLREEFAELSGGATFSKGFIEKSRELKFEIYRLQVQFQSWKVTIASFILPTIVALVSGFVRIIKPVSKLARQSEILKAATIALGLKGFMYLSRLIGPLGAGFKALSGYVTKTILPFLILEDLLVFLKGGDSVIGRSLEKIFGPGTSAMVRKFTDKAVDDSKYWLDNVLHHHDRLKDDWDLILKTMGGSSEGFSNSAVALFTFVVTSFTGGWEQAASRVIAVWDGIKLAGEIVFTELKFACATLTAAVSDLFASMWNGIVENAQGAVTKLIELAGKVPGFKGASEKAIGAVKSVGESAKVNNHLGDLVDAGKAEARLKLAAAGDNISSRLTNVSAPTTTQVTQTINLPPGTPEQTGRRVAKAAADATQGNRAAQNALTQRTTALGKFF